MDTPPDAPASTGCALVAAIVIGLGVGLLLYLNLTADDPPPRTPDMLVVPQKDPHGR